MRLHPFVAAALLSTTACVSSGRYDAAVKDAADAHTAAATEQATNRRLQSQVEKLRKGLDDETSQNAELRAELERLGKNADTLLA